MSERLRAIVDGLGIRHDDRVLEIGCEDWQELLCVSVLAYLGPRRRAASSARRRDVDLERGTIRFREKGGKVTVKPLPDELTAIIRAADENHVWSSDVDYLIPNRRPHRNRERSAKVIYDTVKKVAARVGVRPTCTRSARRSRCSSCPRRRRVLPRPGALHRGSPSA